MTSRRWGHHWLLALMTCGALPGGAAAQDPARSEVARPYATRAELQALLDQTLPSQAQQAETRLLRQRLERGDFLVGDRVILLVAQDSALSDTFTVTPQRTLELPNVGPVSLEGVLRSELNDHLASSLRQYIRSPTVRATPLVRIAVLGEVIRPGFYFVPAEALLSQVIMVAGGPTPNTNMAKTVVARGPTTLLTKEEVQEAVVEGATIDRLNMLGGDEIKVGRSGGGLGSTLQIIGAVSGLALTVVGLTQIF